MTHTQICVLNWPSYTIWYRVWPHCTKYTAPGCCILNSLATTNDAEIFLPIQKTSSLWQIFWETILDKAFLLSWVFTSPLFFLPSHKIWELFQGQTTYSRELTYAHCNKSENSDWKLQTIKKRYLEWYGLKKISGMIWVLIKKMWLVQFNFKIPMHVEIRNRNSLTKVQ